MFVQDFNYIPTKTGLAFHESDAFVKLVFGPYGSGKTCMIMNDAKFYALSQAPSPDGIRRTRIGVVRGTYPELASTTRGSIMEVFPAQYGTIRQGGAPIHGLYRFPVGDGPYDYIRLGQPWQPGMGTICQVEFVLQALQVADDAEKIKSANWTFAIINEATSVDYEILTAVMGRVGRYPTENMGGCSYAGVLIDSNQPPQGHFLLNMKANPEDNWDIFEQPPAAFKIEDDLGNVSYEVNHDAENLYNLGAKRKPDDFNEWTEEAQLKFLHDKGMDYYRNQIAAWKLEGRTDKIDSLFCMLDVPMRDGKPVWPMFKYDVHVAKSVIEPVSHSTVIIGYDTSGIHPAAVLFQMIQGHWAIVDEIYGEDMGLEAFVEQALMPLLLSKYIKCNYIVSCDPANAKDAFTGLAPSTHLEQKGLQVFMPKTNDPKTRIRAVDQMLNRSVGGLIVSPHCHLTIKAFQGGYRYKRLRLMGSVSAAYDAKPEKNNHSHIADAIQYGTLYIVREENHIERKATYIVKQLSHRRRILRKVM